MHDTLMIERAQPAHERLANALTSRGPVLRLRSEILEMIPDPGDIELDRAYADMTAAEPAAEPFDIEEEIPSLAEFLARADAVGAGRRITVNGRFLDSPVADIWWWLQAKRNGRVVL